MATNDNITLLADLHRGLRERVAPQTVAAKLVALGADTWLPETEAHELRSLAQHHGRYTSMRDVYRRHPGLERAYTAAATAMAAVTTAAHRDGLVDADLRGDDDATNLLTWVDQALNLLGVATATTRPARRTSTTRIRTVTYTGGWGSEHTYQVPVRPKGQRGHTGGHADARTRMNADQRRETLPGVSVRTYRRAVRAVLHLQQRANVLAAERDREAATAFGKSRLAHTIGLDEFSACEKSAAFVAYYTARLGLRTLFTVGQQARPMDSIAQALLDAALADDGARVDVIAAVLTRQSVLSRLNEAQKGELLAQYYETLAATARVLQRAFDPARDRTNMVVRRGDDSSSWNLASRAFNQARTGWLNLAAALDLGEVVEASCPGKVPALIASDVAYWHTSEGGQQHQDVTVWSLLPLPWDVVLNAHPCPATLVREVCATQSIDADATGWTAPYRQDHLETPVFAPELVHGVIVGSPLLAGLLRGLGVFSGQAFTGSQRDALATLGAPVRA